MMVLKPKLERERTLRVFNINPVYVLRTNNRYLSGIKNRNFFPINKKRFLPKSILQFPCLIKLVPMSMS